MNKNALRRVIDLSEPAPTYPEGTSVPVAYPYYQANEAIWRSPLTEPVGANRPAESLLGIYEVINTQLGPFPNELFQYGMLSTQPYTTFATYFVAQGRPPQMSVAQDITDFPTSRLIGRATVLDLRGQGQSIGRDQLVAAGAERIPDGAMVILQTGYAKTRPVDPDQRYYDSSPGLSLDAARYLAGKKLAAVAIDARTIESPANTDENEDVHTILNHAGTLVVEDLGGLDALPADGVEVIIGLPLRMYGGKTSPARVVAFRMREAEVEFWDLSTPMRCYPMPDPEHPYPFQPPLPERIDPREYMDNIMRRARILPFWLEGGQIRGSKLQRLQGYVSYAHASHTHIEAAFFDPWGKFAIPDQILRRYRSIPLDRVLGPAAVIDLQRVIGPKGVIEARHLEAAGSHVKEGDIVLIKTGIHDWYLRGGSGEYVGVTPGFTEGAAQWLIDRRIHALVIDFPSVEQSQPPGGIVRYTANNIHYMLHRNDIPVCEGLYRFTLIQKERGHAAILPLPTACLGGHPAHGMFWETY